MPNCFQLYPKGSDTPAPLNTVVDAKIAEFLGVPCDPKLWTADWFHVIGFLIACKNDCDLGTDKLRSEVSKWYDEGYQSFITSGRCSQSEVTERRDEMLRILVYLEQNYTSNAWVQIGK